VDQFINWMNGLPNLAIYLVLWIGAAVENVVPAIPADSFVALGGFLAGAGDLDARWVALGAWGANVSGALIVYRLSHVHGPPFFRSGLGRYLLKPHQMERMAVFYERWGTPAIFLSRFVPGVRAIVPVFAGATHQRWPGVVFPLAIASAIWYGGLVQIGVVLGHNLDLLEAVLSGLNRWLGLIGLVVLAGAATWWVRTRRSPHE
jgi:membrane protein DedA with SNARE-associated domain